jgi:hypothetical protein
MYSNPFDHPWTWSGFDFGIVPNTHKRQLRKTK